MGYAARPTHVRRARRALDERKKKAIASVAIDRCLWLVNSAALKSAAFERTFDGDGM
jgi:hypothetical protein